MNILSIESSGLAASVAAADETGALRAEFTVNNKLTHSETLLPMVKEMLAISGIELSSVDAIAVSSGPGSFTGLRIGAATAKGLGLALDIPIVAVSSLKAMAKSLSGLTPYAVCPVMDARREQVYSAAFMNGDYVLPDAPRKLEDFLSELLTKTAKRSEKFIFTGDGVPVYKDKIKEYIESRGKAAIFADSPFDRQRASLVAGEGVRIYLEWLGKNGLDAGAVRERGVRGIDCFDDQVMNPDDFVPDYLRKTQAERELAAGLFDDIGRRSLDKMKT